MSLWGKQIWGKPSLDRFAYKEGFKEECPKCGMQDFLREVEYPGLPAMCSNCARECNQSFRELANQWYKECHWAPKA